MLDMTFAKKYGLEGKGHTVNISKSTRCYVKELHAQAKRVREEGLFWARTCKLRFGK